MTATFHANFLPLFGVAGVDFSAAEVAESLAKLVDTPFTVRLNSGGGIPSEAIAVAEILKAYPGAITCVLEGATAGASVAIAYACNRVHVSPGGWIGIAAPFATAFGDAGDIAAAGARLDEETNAIAQSVVDYKTARGVETTLDAARSILESEKWLSGGEIVASGFADSFTQDDVQPPTPPRPFHWGSYRRPPAHLEEQALAEGLVGVPAWALGDWQVTGAPSARARISSGPIIANAQRTGATITYAPRSEQGAQ